MHDTEDDLGAVVQAYRVFETQLLGFSSGRAWGALHALAEQVKAVDVGVEVAAAHGGDRRHRGLSAGRRLEVAAARVQVARVCTPELTTGRAQVGLAEHQGAYVELSLLCDVCQLLQLDAR